MNRSGPRAEPTRSWRPFISGWWRASCHRARNAILRRCAIGPRGERVAARWLRRRGYRVLLRNARCGKAEADLVALAPGGRTLVIVEVKSTRTRDEDPVGRVDGWKRLRLERLGMAALRRNAHGATGVRFDVISVIFDGLRVRRVVHRPGCFDASH